MKPVLLGTLELALFMDRGAQRFPNNVKLALKSFLVPFALLPLWVYPLYAEPTERLGPRGYAELIAIHGTVMAFYIAALLGLVWTIAHYMKRMDRFWAYVTALNFLSLAGFILTAPLLVMVVTGVHTWEEMYAILVAAALYEFALAGFAAAYILNIPWQLAASLSCFALVLHQLTAQTVFYIIGIA